MTEEKYVSIQRMQQPQTMQNSSALRGLWKAESPDTQASRFKCVSVKNRFGKEERTKESRMQSLSYSMQNKRDLVWFVASGTKCMKVKRAKRGIRRT